MKKLIAIVTLSFVFIVSEANSEETTTTTTTTNPDGSTTVVESTTTDDAGVPLVGPTGVTGTIRRSDRRQDRRMEEDLEDLGDAVQDRPRRTRTRR